MPEECHVLERVTTLSLAFTGRGDVPTTSLAMAIDRPPARHVHLPTLVIEGPRIESKITQPPARATQIHVCFVTGVVSFSQVEDITDPGCPNLGQPKQFD